MMPDLQAAPAAQGWMGEAVLIICPVFP